MSNNFELDVLVHGSPARTYKHNGRVFIEGKEGSEFSIKIKNNTSRRVLAVLTVDGLSAIDGKEAGFESGGYILEPWISSKIPGWRLDNKEVAKFEFGTPPQSYVAKKGGDGNNLGIIGCAFFYEKEDLTQKLLDQIADLEKYRPKEHHHYYPYPHYPTYPTSPWWTYTTYGSGSQTFTVNAGISTMNAVNCSSQAFQMKSKDLDSVNARSSLGTKFGDKTTHKVSEEIFDRATKNPAEVLTIYYDTREGLKRRGVDVDWMQPIAPSAFPKEAKYCEPPSGWNG